MTEYLTNPTPLFSSFQRLQASLVVQTYVPSLMITITSLASLYIPSNQVRRQHVMLIKRKLYTSSILQVASIDI